MSWASFRETTRTEDTAYCLLGIFDVNMPLLYGEEENAFRRLQEEIIKSTADLSIFAWTLPFPISERRTLCVMLAESPAAFSKCGSLAQLPLPDRTEFSISNTGVKTRAQVLWQSIPGKKTYSYVLPLDCVSPAGEALGVRLRKVGPDQFLREDTCTLVKCENGSSNPPREIYLLTRPLQPLFDQSLRNIPANLLIPWTRTHALQIELLLEMHIYDAWPWGRFDNEDQVFFVTGNRQSDSCILRLNGVFNFPFDEYYVGCSFDCMLYAVGWANATPGHLQCSLFEYRPYAERVNELKSRISDWDHDSAHVLGLLAYHQVPKSAGVAKKIPGSSKSALLSFTPRLVSDPTICHKDFWRIEFSCRVYETAELPLIDQGEWTVE